MKQTPLVESHGRMDLPSDISSKSTEQRRRAPVDSIRSTGYIRERKGN
ncbi:MAG: hypothetical protein V1878_01880 [bacterium]